MANKCELAGLQQLAADKIERCGTSMNISDVIDAIDKDFSRFPDSTNWFQDYLTAKVKYAFEKDYNALSKHGIFDRISNIALSKALARYMMELYNDKLSRILHTDSSMQEVNQKGVPQVYERADGASADGVQKNNGNDWDTDRKRNKMKTKKRQREEEEAESKRNEEVEETERKKGEEEAATAAATIIDKGILATATGKKKRKKKGRALTKEASTGAEFAPEPALEPSELELEEPLVDHFAGLGKGQRKKMEKKLKEAKEAELKKKEEEAETENKKIREEEAAAAGAMAESESAKKEDHPWDIWGVTAVATEKKIEEGKHLNKEELSAPLPEPDPALTAEDEIKDDGWGDRKTVELNPIPEPEPVVEDLAFVQKPDNFDGPMIEEKFE